MMMSRWSVLAAYLSEEIPNYTTPTNLIPQESQKYLEIDL